MDLPDLGALFGALNVAEVAHIAGYALAESCVCLDRIVMKPEMSALQGSAIWRRWSPLGVRRSGGRRGLITIESGFANASLRAVGTTSCGALLVL
jgi:hypothetical protein